MKKLLKILAFIAAGFLAIVIILIIGITLFFPTEKVKTMAIERGSEALGRDVAIDDVELSFWGGLGVKLHGVRIGNPADMVDETELLKADDIDVKLAILPLLSSEYRVERLILERPQIRMHRLSDGRDNFSFGGIDSTKVESEGTQFPVGAQPPGEAQVAAAALSFDKLEIVDGILSYNDDRSGNSVHLSGISLATSLQNPRPNFYHSDGKFAVGEISISGDWPVPSSEIALSWSADYDAGRKYVSLKEARLQVGKMSFDLGGELSHVPDSLMGRASIQSDRIRVEDMLSLASPERLSVLEDFEIRGGFSLSAEVDYSERREEALLYSGTAVMAGLEIGYAEVAGKLRCERAMLDFKPNNIRVNIEEGTFNNKSLKGHLVVNNFDDPVINAEVAGELDMVFLKPFLPLEGNHDLAGTAAIAVKLSGQLNELESLDASGNITIPHGRYASALMPEPIDSFSLDAYFDRKVIRVKQFVASSPSSRLSFAGRITDLVPYLLADSIMTEQMEVGLDGQLSGNLNLALLNSYLSPEGAPELNGDFEMKLSVIGDVNHPTTLRPRGTVTVTDGSYTDTLIAEPVRAWAARLRIVPDTILVDDLNVQFVSSDLHLTGSLVKPLPYLLPFEGIDRSRYEKPRFNFELTSHRLNVDSLFPEAAPMTGREADGQITGRTEIDSVSAILLPDIVAEGRFTLDTLVYCEVDLTDVIGRLSYEDRRVVCRDVTGSAYSGTIAGQTTIDLADMERPVYEGEFQATQIEADDFVRRFTKFGGHIFGRFNFSGSYQAEGWEPDEFLNSLTMDGQSVMQNGRVVTSGSIHKVLSTLVEQVGGNISEDQLLKNAQTKISVRDGRVTLDTLRTQLGTLGDLAIGGYYSFQNAVSYSGTILLSAETTKRLTSNKGLLGAVSGLLSNGNGNSNRIRLPFLVSGTVDKPKAEIDYSSLTKGVGENLLDDAGSKLKGLFKKK
ncbi:MAG: AsmA family protein [candidate division Zixibacteria bacterium]|nr:AsmA family protein [candidate division Zixibacteria bacterium]